MNLNQKKIRKIIRWKEKGKRTKVMAKKLNISERRVQQIWREYRETGRIPELKRRGRRQGT
ncbi:helix-turn-helix domain-containing protein [Methanotorris formicicus]|uniref:helix-turn-helix domain-containing protein n=1 Tax=Methanotorris formicicus TaxID=213185 RepID=UPI00064E2ED6|nr:helix-turn-helix domain-containing protein [Methanotorris formicicus]